MPERLRGAAALASLGDQKLGDEEELALRMQEHRRAVAAFLGEPAGRHRGFGRGFWIGLGIALVAILVLGVVGVVQTTWTQQQKQQEQQQQQEHAKTSALPPAPGSRSVVEGRWIAFGDQRACGPTGLTSAPGRVSTR